MEEKTFKNYVDDVFNDEIIKIIVSNPNKIAKYKKIVIEHKPNGYYVSNYTDKQVFNENINLNKLKTKLNEYIVDFKQINFFSCDTEYMIKRSKKDKLFFSKSTLKNVIKTTKEHNREKEYLINKI